MKNTSLNLKRPLKFFFFSKTRDFPFNWPSSLNLTKLNDHKSSNHDIDNLF